MKRLTALLFSTSLLVALIPPALGQEEPAAERTDNRPIDISAKPAPDLDAVVDVFIQLTEEPVAEFVAEEEAIGRGLLTRAAQQAQARRVEQQQEETRLQLGELIHQEKYSLQVGANGIVADVRVGDIPDIAALPQVQSVAPVVHHRPHNSTSVSWIGTPEFWQTHGLTGEDISIAVIDTGIDYLHADFGGSGNPADYEANDTTVVEEDTFPTAKVVGGTDFAGVNYNASDPDNDQPRPDPDPLDVNGHGTHVAGSAAGFGVLVDGSTYGGPYDASTHENEFEVGPGVAPEAVLYALKVFGDQAGSTALTAQAIEWALDPNDDGDISDHLDVINMSLGSDFGHPDDPSAVASQNAAENGVIVVASAGNDGPIPYVTGSPAVAPGAISVAASIDGGLTVDALQVNSPDDLAGLYEAAEGGITEPLSETGPVTGDLAVTEPLRACEPLANPEAIAGNIAFIERGDCFFSVKILNAQEAGATAVVVFNNVGGPPIVMGGDSTGIDIPGMMITQQDGQTFLSAIEGGDTINVTLSDAFELPKPELADHLASFTSRGPGTGELFKPDVAAPGFGILSAAVGSGTRASNLTGTSMAAPHVAGMAALLRQQHPELHVDGIKSLIMNSTAPAQAESGVPPISLQGTGVVRVDDAGSLESYTTPGGVSFGRINPVTGSAESRSINVTNVSGAEKTYGITVEYIQQPAGTSLSVPAQVTVPAGGTAQFEATLSVDPGTMDADNAFRSQREADGRILLSDGSQTLKVGWFGVVDPASAAQASANPGRAVAVTLENPSDTIAFVTGYTLAKQGDDVGGDIGAIGVRTREVAGFEVVEFGVAQTVAWDNLSTRETDIFLDPDEDGIFEYLLVAADLGYLTTGFPDGRVVTALFDLVNAVGFLEWFAIYDHNDQVQRLLVDRHGRFGFLEEGDLTFDYLAFTFDLRFAAPDGIQAGSVDLSKVDGYTNPDLALGPGESQTIQLTPADRDAVLWIYPNNTVDNQFQIQQVAPRRGRP